MRSAVLRYGTRPSLRSSSGSVAKDEVDKLSMVYDSLRELRDELVQHEAELLRGENEIYEATQILESAENRSSAVRDVMRGTNERIINVMNLIEQYALRLEPASVKEIKKDIVREHEVEGI